MSDTIAEPRVNGVPRMVHRMSPAAFWLAVDDELAAIGQAPALWLEELARWYAAGRTVHSTVLVVLAGRSVKK